MTCGLSYGQLLVDFDSNQDTGPHTDAAGGFQSYFASHEVAAEFVTQSFSAFGTSVGVTPTWPNTTANTVQQSIDRGAGNDANWTDATTDLAASPVPILGLDLVTDFIGTDTREAQGGNGDWDGTTGTPTLFDLSLSGLPANTYQWQSSHIDTENVHGEFAAWVSTDGGANFTAIADGVMTDASPGGSPSSDGTAFSATNTLAAAQAGAIYTANFAADGTNDVVLRFAPYSSIEGVHKRIWGMNALVLQEAVPEPGSMLLSLIAAFGLVGFVRRRR